MGILPMKSITMSQTHIHTHRLGRKRCCTWKPDQHCHLVKCVWRWPWLFNCQSDLFFFFVCYLQTQASFLQFPPSHKSIWGFLQSSSATLWTKGKQHLIRFYKALFYVGSIEWWSWRPSVQYSVGSIMLPSAYWHDIEPNHRIGLSLVCPL